MVKYSRNIKSEKKEIKRDALKMHCLLLSLKETQSPTEDKNKFNPNLIYFRLILLLTGTILFKLKRVN